MWKIVRGVIVIICAPWPHANFLATVRGRSRAGSAWGGNTKGSTRARSVPRRACSPKLGGSLLHEQHRTWNAEYRLRIGGADCPRIGHDGDRVDGGGRTVGHSDALQVPRS